MSGSHTHPLPEERPDLCGSCQGPVSDCCTQLQKYRAQRAKQARERRLPKPTRVNRTADALRESWSRSGPLDPPTAP